MKYWFFGASSEYASYIIEDLESAGHEVIKFGRHNVDYSKPEEFINSINTNELPDRVFFNANIFLLDEQKPIEIDVRGKLKTAKITKKPMYKAKIKN